MLTETSSRRHSGWLTIGERFSGYSILSFAPEHEVLYVRKNGRIERLTLKQEFVHRAPVPSEAARTFIANLAISGATPSSEMRRVGLLYVHNGDHYRAVPVGQAVSDQLGIKVRSVTAESSGVVIVFEEASGALISRTLVEQRPNRGSEPGTTAVMSPAAKELRQP